MNTMNMPGFTAEHSLYRTNRHFHTGVSDTLSVLDAEVRPQLRCLPVGGGDIICGDIPGGGGGGGDDRGDRFEAQCRAGCLRIRSVAARRQCLADC